MSILPAAILTAIAVPALGNPAMQSASTKPSKARPKVAVFTFSGGYKHDVLELAEKTIAQLTKKHDDFEVVLHHQYRQEAGKLDLSMINADYLEQFAGIGLCFFTQRKTYQESFFFAPSVVYFMKLLQWSAAI